MKRQPPCWRSKVDFFFLCHGRNVTILTRAHTVLYGFKNFVQNSVFAFLNYIIGSLCIGQIQASTSPRATPRATPRAFDFFENYCSNSPLPGPKCCSNAPHWGHFKGTKMTEGRQKRLRLSNKIFTNITKTEKHC